MSLLIVVISIFFLFILFVIGLIAFRRWRRGVYFKKLDREVERMRPLLQGFLVRQVVLPLSDWRYPPDTIEWEALERCLLETKATADDEGKRTIEHLFQELGYTSYYQSLLRKGNRWKRALAAERLGVMGTSKESVNGLVKALKDSSKEVRSISLRSFAQIADESSIPLLVEELPNMVKPEGGVFVTTLKNAIVKMGETILPLLLPKMEEYSEDILSMVIESLGEIGSTKAVPVLIRQLNHSHPEIRSKAAKALGKIREPSAFPALLKMEDEPVWYVRLQVCRALGHFQDPRGVHFLMNRLLDPNWQVRAAASEALLRIEPHALAAITQTLRMSEDRYAKEQIAEEMQRCGMVEELINSLEDPSDPSLGLKKELLKALVSLGIQSLMKWASRNHPSKVVRDEVFRILKWVGESSNGFSAGA